jgi:hypothetical protein
VIYVYYEHGGPEPRPTEMRTQRHGLGCFSVAKPQLIGYTGWLTGHVMRRVCSAYDYLGRLFVRP